MSGSERVKRIRIFARGASVVLKIAAAVVGFIAAYFWYRSVTATSPADATEFNQWAAMTTAASVLLQGLCASVDAWVAPTATWG
jgi:hypothetical protein